MSLREVDCLHTKKDVTKDGQADSSYQSCTDVSSVASTSVVSLGAIRDPLADAKPIANPKLREKLELAGTNGSVKLRSRRSSAVTGGRHSMPVLKPADQKILELMMAKQEEQAQQKLRRESAHRQWETERQKASSTQNLSESARRRSVSCAEQRRQWEQRRAQIERRERPMSIDHSLQQGTHKQGTLVNSRRTSLAETPRKKPRDDCTESCNGSLDTAAQRQLELKKQMEEKALRELQKKRAQETRLEMKRREIDEHQQRLKEDQDRVLKRAQSAKEVRNQEHALKLKMRNFQMKKRQEEKLNKVKQQSVENLSHLRQQTDQRLDRASQKKQQIEQQKEMELLHNHHDHESRQAKSQLIKQQHEEDMSRYQTAMITYRRELEEQAEALAKEAIEAKRLRTLSDQQQRTRLQKKNMQKLMENEETWKAEVEANIAMKDSRLKVLQMEKEEKVALSRAVAHTSQLLREKLKSHYSMTDLDRLNRQAQAEAKIRQPPSRGSPAAVTNQMSRLSLLQE